MSDNTLPCGSPYLDLNLTTLRNPLGLNAKEMQQWSKKSISKQ